jgi:hypothetical protein
MTPPIVIRMVRRTPVKKWPAIGICILFGILEIGIFIALGSDNTGHAVVLVMGFVSYWILRREHFFGRSKKIDELQPTFDEDSQQLETQSHTEVIGTFDQMLATDEEIEAKEEAESLPRVSSLELEAAKKPNKSAENGGAKPRWKARGIALSSIWTLFIIMGDVNLFGYAPWRLKPFTSYSADGEGTALFAWLMGVAVSFIVAWVFLNRPSIFTIDPVLCPG